MQHSHSSTAQPRYLYWASFEKMDLNRKESIRKREEWEQKYNREFELLKKKMRMNGSLRPYEWHWFIWSICL